MLPGRTGWQILQDIRQSGKSTPVLFLTARVRTLLRRERSRDPGVLHIADLELDLRRRRAQRSGLRIDLTAKEFALLELLTEVTHPAELAARRRHCVVLSCRFSLSMQSGSCCV